MNSNCVSIVMPVYNGEIYLKQAIESVLAQTYANWELIVVDDGSTDETAKLVAAFTDSRIRYVYQANRGQAAALNRGLDLAKGDYVTTLDADDWLTGDSLWARARFLDQHPEFGAVYGDGYYCDLAGTLLKRFAEYRKVSPLGDIYPTLITTPFFGTGANVMVRQKVLAEHQIQYDEAIVWCQDWDIYIRIAEQTQFGLVRVPTVWYRLHEANMTMSMPSGRRLESLIRTKFKVLTSPRFATISTQQKIAFFYYFLTEDLADRLPDQIKATEHTHFRSLPKQAQARLLRIAANNHLLQRRHLTYAKAWLRRAWLLTPFDLKTVSAAALANLNFTLAKKAVQRSRQSHERPEQPSLLELARREKKKQATEPKQEKAAITSDQYSA